MKKVFVKNSNDFYYICILLVFLGSVTAVIGFLGIGFGPIHSFKVAFYIIACLLVISAILGRILNDKRKKNIRL